MSTLPGRNAKANSTAQFGGGAPTDKTVAEFGEKVEKSKQSPYMLLNPLFVDDANLTPEQNIQNTRAINSSKFPIRPFPTDSYDSVWQMKQDMANPVISNEGVVIAPPMATPSRPLPFTESDVTYLKRKRDDEDMVAFLTWQANKYDLTDPATRDWFAKRCPSYFEQRESLIDQQIDRCSRYAKIRLRGAKNEDDLLLEYLIETGRVDLPKGEIWEPFSWMLRQAGTVPEAPVQQQKAAIENYNSDAYRKGLFNPTKVMTPQKGGLLQNPYNKGDIAGYPRSNYTGLPGASISTSSNYNAAYGGAGGLFDNRTRLPAQSQYSNLIRVQNDARLTRASQTSAGMTDFRPPIPYQQANPYYRAKEE